MAEKKDKKEKKGKEYSFPPKDGVGSVYVLLGWRVIARLKHETVELDEEAAQRYVRDIQAKSLDQGGKS